MNTFPLEEEAWYVSRDDRTKRAVEIDEVRDFSLGVLISPSVESSYSIQAMSAIALNLLARWCRKLKVQISPHAVSSLPYTHGQNLKDSLARELANIDPYGQFDFDATSVDGCDQILIIGKPWKSQETNRPPFWIDSSGWTAGIGCDFPTVYSDTTKDESNPVGAAFAACLGVSEAFRRAIGVSPEQSKSVWYSLYDFKMAESQAQLNSPRYISEPDFGQIHQIGCGAVASSLDFLIALTQWKATIHLIDYDAVGFTDCNRCLPFYARDAVSKRDKVEACASALASSKMSPVVFKGDYGEFIAKNGFLNLAPDLILCLANEKNIWATIQYNLPPLVFHATTTMNWAVNFGRHIPRKEWCLLCRFSKDLDNRSQPVCGEVGLNRGSEQKESVLGVLPFLSTTAAVLVLAEMAKMNIKEYPVSKDFVEFSTRNLGAPFITVQRTAEEECVCNEQSLDVYQKEIRASKFWWLTSGNKRP